MQKNELESNDILHGILFYKKKIKKQTEFFIQIDFNYKNCSKKKFP